MQEYCRSRWKTRLRNQRNVADRCTDAQRGTQHVESIHCGRARRFALQVFWGKYRPTNIGNARARGSTRETRTYFSGNRRIFGGKLRRISRKDKKPVLEMG